MHYRASSILEYPILAWPFILLTFAELIITGTLFYLYKGHYISITDIIFGAAILMGFMSVEYFYVKELNKKLRKEILVDDRGIRIVDTLFKNVFFFSGIYETKLTWDQIESIELTNHWKGPIRLKTPNRTITFWFGFRPDVNGEIVKTIKARLSGSESQKKGRPL